MLELKVKMKKNVAVPMLVLPVLIGSAFARGQCSPAEPPATPKTAQSSPTSGTAENTDKPISDQLNRLLDKIEQAGAKLQSFQADMTFKQKDLLHESLTLRNGNLYYRVDKDTVRFRIHFKDLQQQYLEEETVAKPVKFDEDYAFDGLWVTRRNGHTRQIQMWEVSKQHSDKETFRLGKGPFPLPFAIKKKDVLEHFEIELVAPDPNDPASTDHLKLLPKKKSPYAEEYVQMNLWISNADALPVQVSYEKDNYEITTVRWSKIEIDKKIKDEIFKLKPAGKGWSVEKNPLEETPKKPPN